MSAISDLRRSGHSTTTRPTSGKINIVLGKPATTTFEAASLRSDVVITMGGFESNKMQRTISSTSNPFTEAVLLLSAEVKKQFTAIDEVEAIFREISDYQVKFYVFTDNKVFDIDLLQRLATIEIALAEKHPTVEQEYEYVASVLVSNHRSVTGENATSIFER